MRTAILTRFFGDTRQSLGSIVVPSDELFMCKTLELGWHDNKSNTSCIPPGSYTCKWTRSNRLSSAAGHDVFTYEVLGVPNRAGIRIHSANYFFQLLGCISLGSSHKDINADANLDVIHSGVTVEKFNKRMNKEDFILKIVNSPDYFNRPIADNSKIQTSHL